MKPVPNWTCLHARGQFQWCRSVKMYPGLGLRNYFPKAWKSRNEDVILGFEILTLRCCFRLMIRVCFGWVPPACAEVWYLRFETLRSSRELQEAWGGLANVAFTRRGKRCIICMYAYIYIYIHIHTYTWTYTHIWREIHTFIIMCIYVYTSYVYMSIYIYIHIYKHTSLHIKIHIYIYTHTHIYT